jgi:hypothetical protein
MTDSSGQRQLLIEPGPPVTTVWNRRYAERMGSWSGGGSWHDHAVGGPAMLIKQYARHICGCGTQAVHAAY